MARFTTGNPEAHDYLEGIEPRELSPLERMDGNDLEKHYEELMRHVDDNIRRRIETANYTPQDEFEELRRAAFHELCRRGIREWDIRV